MKAYYNEMNKKAAAGLRALIEDGFIAPGDVDERPIQEVQPDDLKGYTQCHFFAGIGGWSVALCMAGFPDDRPVWTGSCPCQPFSTAGKQKGKADERHLWPVWFRLISQSRPPVVFGEQVSAAIRHGWWDDVSDDMEGIGYTTRAEVRPACSAGAPHKRDRLWFVAHSESKRSGGAYGASSDTARGQEGNNGVQLGRTGTLGNPEHDGRHGRQVWGGDAESILHDAQRKDCTIESTGAGQPEHVADTTSREEQSPSTGGFHAESGSESNGSSCGDVANAISQRGRGGDGEWENAENVDAPSEGGGFQWILCPDGKSRPIVCKIYSLANGVSHDIPRVDNGGNEVAQREEVNAAQARANEKLPDMWSADYEEKIWQKTRGHECVSEKEILQPNLCEHKGQPKAKGLLSKSEEVSQESLLPLPGKEQSSRSPHRQEPAQQRSVEFTDFVRFLSSQISLAKWTSEAQDALPLQDLWQACKGKEVFDVRQALSEIQKVWRCLDDKERERKQRLLFNQRRYFWRPMPLLETGVSSRSHILRGLGNAIHPPTAAAFIKATEG